MLEFVALINKSIDPFELVVENYLGGGYQKFVDF